MDEYDELESTVKQDMKSKGNLSELKHEALRSQRSHSESPVSYRISKDSNS